MKTFHLQYGVGTAKYLVSFHDGVKKNEDGSSFFDCRIFSNKKELNAFLKELWNDGYINQ
jgi:hypothetical protein